MGKIQDEESTERIAQRYTSSKEPKQRRNNYTQKLDPIELELQS